MYKIVASLITGGMIAVSGSILAQVPKIAGDGAPAAEKEQSKDVTAVKVRAAYKQEAPQIQPSAAQRNASFLVFLSFLYGRK